MNKRALTMLKKWIDFAFNDVYVFPDRPDLACYGAGYNGWGMQTHQKALAAFIIIGTNGDIDTSDMKIDRGKILDYSLKMFRFMIESHKVGNYECAEGEKWGHTWISVLGTERVMHAIEELLKYLTDEDREKLRNMMISEADWLLDFYDMPAGPTAESGNNKPESNIWNGSFLHRVASMYPDCSRVEQYKNKATAFLVNGISHPDDEYSTKIYDGKQVSEWYVGNNFYGDYALDHHGYLNIGYMVICISNIAMYHFSCKKLGLKAPDALYHRAFELWKLIKTFIFDDGRLIRIGGDTRFRYCYCQDYLLPSLTFAKDYFNDKDSEFLENRLIDLFYTEFKSNNDGSFLSDRCNKLRGISPIYYTRLEADKAAVLSMAVNWSNITQIGKADVPYIKNWCAPSHGSVAIRGENRFASWSFKSAAGMTGLCLPVGEGNLAEWQNNLAAEILGSGASNDIEVIHHSETMFDDGFIAFGEVNHLSDKFLAEQQKAEVISTEHIVYAALPDDMTVVVMQYATTPQRIYLKRVRGINLNIPNDLYNEFSREYYYENDKYLAERFGKEKLIDLNSNWVNIDNKLGLIAAYTNESINLYRPGKRQITIVPRKEWDNMQNHYTEHFSCDVFCTEMVTKPKWTEKNEVILDTAGIIMAGSTSEDTREKAKLANKRIEVCNTHYTRSVTACGNDGFNYIVISNVSDVSQIVKINNNQKNLLDIVGVVDVAKNTTIEDVVEIQPKGAVILKEIPLHK